MKQMFRAVACAGFSLALVAPALAQDSAPRNVQFLVGESSRAVDYELPRLGYEQRGGSKGGGRSFTNWWNGRSDTCITVATEDGRVAAISSVPEFDCGFRGGESGVNNRPHGQHWYDEYIQGSPRAASAEFERRGYVNFDGEKSRYSAYTWWYQRDRDHCFKMTVNNGRVTDIEADRPHCDRMR